MPFFGLPYTVKMIDSVHTFTLQLTMDTRHSAGDEWYKAMLVMLMCLDGDVPVS